MKRIAALLLAALTAVPCAAAQEAASGLDAIAAHLSFLGYTCQKKGKSLEARHPAKLSFDVTPHRGGFILRGWFTRSAQAAASKAKYAELLNTINGESTVCRYYFDKETDLIIEAWYPGGYAKESFAAFMTAWEQDFISTVQKHFAALKTFISN